MGRQQDAFDIHVPFVEHLGIRMTEKQHGVVRLRLEPRPEFENSWGSMHGGVLMTMSPGRSSKPSQRLLS